MIFPQTIVVWLPVEPLIVQVLLPLLAVIVLNLAPIVPLFFTVKAQVQVSPGFDNWVSATLTESLVIVAAPQILPAGLVPVEEAASGEPLISNPTSQVWAVWLTSP